MTDKWITLRCSFIVSLGGQAERQEAGRKDGGGEARAGSVRWARGWRDEGPHRASRNGLQCVLSPGYEIAILQTWPHPCGHAGAPESRLFDGALQPGLGRGAPFREGNCHPVWPSLASLSPHLPARRWVLPLRAGSLGWGREGKVRSRLGAVSDLLYVHPAPSVCA